MFSGISVGISRVKCRSTVRQVSRDANIYNFDKISRYRRRYRLKGEEIWIKEKRVGLKNGEGIVIVECVLKN